MWLLEFIIKWVLLILFCILKLCMFLFLYMKVIIDNFILGLYSDVIFSGFFVDMIFFVISSGLKFIKDFGLVVDI